MWDPKKENKPTIAPGIDNDEELNAEATDSEIEKGDFTEVTRLVWDENDPSGEERED